MAPQSKYASKLAGAHVLIVGGSSGLGFGVAEALIEFNAAYIAISSSNPKRVEDAVNRLKSSYPDTKTKIQGIAINLADQANLETNVQKLFADLDLNGKKLDHIVHTAGDSLAVKSLDEVDMSYAVQAGMVRFFAPLMIAKHSKQYLKEGPDSSVTLTTGLIAQQPIPNWTVVAGYAAGLLGMVQNLALDRAPTRFNLVSPSLVDSELWKDLKPEQREGLMAGHAKKTTVGRVGRVEDVAEAFLYSMRDGNVTGTLLGSNGGKLLL